MIRPGSAGPGASSLSTQSFLWAQWAQACNGLDNSTPCTEEMLPALTDWYATYLADVSGRVRGGLGGRHLADAWRTSHDSSLLSMQHATCWRNVVCLFRAALTTTFERPFAYACMNCSTVKNLWRLASKLLCTLAKRPFPASIPQPSTATG